MSLSDNIAMITNMGAILYKEDVKEKIGDFLKDIKTICPNTKFNEEVDEKALEHFGKELVE